MDMNKEEAKQFFSNYFSFDDIDIQELEFDSYLDCSCADQWPEGWQTKFEFFDSFCLVHHFPYYKGERQGDSSTEYVQYTNFEDYMYNNL